METPLNPAIEPVIPFRKLDLYAEFLVWCHDKLTDIDWCLENLTKAPKGYFKMDSDIPGKEYHYCYHRYNRMFFGSVANFFYHTRFGYSPEMELMQHYNKSVHENCFSMEAFRGLEVGASLSTFIQVFAPNVILTFLLIQYFPAQIHRKEHYY